MTHGKCRVVNIKSGDQFDIYIGRGSKWGNPYALIDRSRAERDFVCDMYEKYLVDSGLINDIHELRGKVLGCYCKPLRCHGDFLARLVNERFGDQ